MELIYIFLLGLPAMLVFCVYTGWAVNGYWNAVWLTMPLFQQFSLVAVFSVIVLFVYTLFSLVRYWFWGVELMPLNELGDCGHETLWMVSAMIGFVFAKGSAAYH